MFPSQITDLRLPFVIICSSLVLAGCVTVESQTFQATANPNVEASYIATDANFAKYTQLTADEMGIFFPQSVDLSPDELSRIRQIFRESFMEELEGYTIVQETGPQTLMVQASLIDLRNASYGDVPQLRRELQSTAKPGSLVFLMELRDSESDRVLGRAADSAVAPRFEDGSTDVPDWNAVEDAAKHWAGLFRSFLDQNLGT